MTDYYEMWVRASTIGDFCKELDIPADVFYAVYVTVRVDDSGSYKTDMNEKFKQLIDQKTFKKEFNECLK